jgi:hypothetical protein
MHGEHRTCKCGHHVAGDDVTRAQGFNQLSYLTWYSTSMAALWTHWEHALSSLALIPTRKVRTVQQSHEPTIALTVDGTFAPSFDLARTVSDVMSHASIPSSPHACIAQQETQDTARGNEIVCNDLTIFKITPARAIKSCQCHMTPLCASEAQERYDSSKK